MKKVMIVDARFSDIAKNEWGSDFDIIPSAKCEYTDEAISYHPDVSVLKVGKNLICAPCVYDYYKEKLLPYGILPEKGEKDPDRHYPSDCAYNIAITKNEAIFKKGIIDAAAQKRIDEEGLKKIYVSQGYAKCSSVCFEGGIITADASIFKAALNSGVKCLKIKEGEVILKPYDYGFLGGASGNFKNEMYFFGDLSRHTDYLKIKQFLEEEKIKIKYIKNLPLTDIGTIIFP